MREISDKLHGYMIERKLILGNGREIPLNDNTEVVEPVNYQDDEEYYLIDELLTNLGKHIKGLSWIDNVGTHQVFCFLEPEDVEDESN